MDRGNRGGRKGGFFPYCLPLGLSAALAVDGLVRSISPSPRWPLLGSSSELGGHLVLEGTIPVLVLSCELCGAVQGEALPPPPPGVKPFSSSGSFQQEERCGGRIFLFRTCKSAQRPLVFKVLRVLASIFLIKIKWLQRHMTRDWLFQDEDLAVSRRGLGCICREFALF
jgi:hypothetical protein